VSTTGELFEYVATKTCRRCGETKSVGEFYKVGRVCKTCKNEHGKQRYHANIELFRESRRKWRQENRDKYREILRIARLKRVYGITIAGYDAKLAEQGGVCAICGTDKPGGQGTFHVDHCHSTGKFRGVLSNDCNTGIGKLGDTAAGVLRAYEYLKRFEAST
jgi:hypothetical protein